MLKKITLSLALIVACATSSQLLAQITFHEGGTTALYEKAESEKKLIFIDLYASWCPPCKAMERDVFSRKDVGEFMSKSFVCAKYSVDESIGKSLANQYGVSSIPTYLIFNTDGDLVGRKMGSMSAEDFIKEMQAAIERSQL
ncbi:MAG: thioredoxin family protein [Rikenellaceae bacterium]